MNSGKMIAFFLLSLLIGSGCFAEAPSPSQAKPSAQGVTPAVSQPVGQWSEGWYKGADGYEKAIQEYRQTQKAVAVYVNVSWCPYCRKFEKGILSSPIVKDFMKDKIKVSIDPESGAREKEIVAQYRIRGFPSFFLHSSKTMQAMQLSTSVSPEEFIKNFEQAQK